MYRTVRIWVCGCRSTKLGWWVRYMTVTFLVFVVQWCSAETNKYGERMILRSAPVRAVCNKHSKQSNGELTRKGKAGRDWDHKLNQVCLSFVYVTVCKSLITLPALTSGGPLIGNSLDFRGVFFFLSFFFWWSFVTHCFTYLSTVQYIRDTSVLYRKVSSVVTCTPEEQKRRKKTKRKKDPSCDYKILQAGIVFSIHGYKHFFSLFFSLCFGVYKSIARPVFLISYETCTIFSTNPRHLEALFTYLPTYLLVRFVAISSCLVGCLTGPSLVTQENQTYRFYWTVHYLGIRSLV